MRGLSSVLVMLLRLSLFAQSQVKVEVTLSRPDAGGVLMLALCPSASTYASEKGCFTTRADAIGAVVPVVFGDLPPGRYALKVFHDIDRDGVLDTNWMGIPKEPYGFGNDAMGTFGPPGFDEASFQVGEGRTLVRVRMKG